ncbi:MAG TPA: hypothetical protein ENJ28_02915 [Gammaproteobacteria bacterium]|nr:hypothetical protein [Gammaproteobacteria bacterium]
MKLYLITAPCDFGGWDTYDSAVVSAKSLADAKEINPSKCVTHVKNGRWMGTYKNGGEYDQDTCSGWVRYSEIEKVKAKYLGETKMERGVVLVSFNAG